MANHKGISSSKAPQFDGSNYAFWKMRMSTHIMSLGINIWMDVENGYRVPTTPPTYANGKIIYTNNSMEKNSILSCLSYIEFIKAMHCKSAKELLDKL